MESACQNLWDTAKAVLKEKFVALNTNILKKRKISNQVSKLPLQEARRRTE